MNVCSWWLGAMAVNGVKRCEEAREWAAMLATLEDAQLTLGTEWVGVGQW